MWEPSDFGFYAVSLIVVVGDGEGEEHPVQAPRWVVGRGPEADVCFEDPALAPRHLAVLFESGRFSVSLVDGERALLNGAAVSEAELRNGDHLELGSHVVQVLIERKDAAPIFTTSARAGDPEDPIAFR